MARRLSRKTAFAAATTPAAEAERPVLSRMLGIVKGNPRKNEHVVTGDIAALETYFVELDLSDISFTGTGNAKRWQIVNAFREQIGEQLKAYMAADERTPDEVSAFEIGLTSSSAVALHAQTPEQEQKKGYIVLQVHPLDAYMVDMALQRIKLAQGPQVPAPGFRAG